MKIKALLFDFDGLILDTESPEFNVWQAIYREHGQELKAEQWGQIVGGWGASHFDAAENLVELIGNGINAEELDARQRSESEALTLNQPIMPGVVDYLDSARSLGLRLAVASSSPHSWVDTHLTRLMLADRFDAIICAEDVPLGRTKPNPDLFVKALEAVDAAADEAIVFEDSPNGVQAARAAGIYTVSVPNPVTAMLETNGANMTINSLADITLKTIMIKASNTI